MSLFGQQPVSAAMDQYQLTTNHHHQQQHQQQQQHQHQHQHQDQQLVSGVSLIEPNQQQQQMQNSYSSQEAPSDQFNLLDYNGPSCRSCGYQSCKCIEHNLGFQTRSEPNFVVQQVDSHYQMHQTLNTIQATGHIIDGTNLINLDLGYEQRDDYNREISSTTNNTNSTIENHHYLTTKQQDIHLVLNHQDQQQQASSLQSDNHQNEISTSGESHHQNQMVSEADHQFSYSYSGHNNQQQQQQQQQQWSQLIETKQDHYDQRLNQFDYHYQKSSNLDNDSLQDFNGNNNHQAQNYQYSGNKTIMIEHNSYIPLLNKQQQHENNNNLQNDNTIANNKSIEDKFFYSDNQLETSDTIKYNDSDQIVSHQKQNLISSSTKRRQSHTAHNSPSDQRYDTELPNFNQLDRRDMSYQQPVDQGCLIGTIDSATTRYMFQDLQTIDQDEQLDKSFTNQQAAVANYQPIIGHSISSGADPQSSQRLRSTKGRRGRPRKKGLRSKNKVNGKLWEFIRDLLLSERTNPSFIRWERREDGVFKFVQSDKVAKMWGERKQNPKMTYEKLSRAMRYYYKSKVLLPVFGRRLVYKFGPNATGWLPSAGDTCFWNP